MIHFFLASSCGSCLGDGLLYPSLFLSFAIISLVGLVGIVILFILDFIKAGHLGSKAACVALAFFFGLFLWSGIEYGYGKATNFAGFSLVLSNTIKMFAFSVTNDDLPLAVANQANSYGLFASAAVIIEEVICVGLLSITIVTSLGRYIIAWGKNVIRRIQPVKNKDKRHDYFFTNLKFEELKDFLQIRSNAHDVITIVVKQDDQLTQEGTELRNSYLSNGYETIYGPIRSNFIGECLFPFFRNIKKGRKAIFYSCFKDDHDNLAFADAALEFCRDKLLKPEPYTDTDNEKKTRTVANNLGSSVSFFISYQDPDFEKNYNYSSDSRGLISFFSEYDWVSSNFVFLNPSLRIIKCGDSDSKEGRIEGVFHVDLLGYGGINKAMLKKLIPAYYLPNDSPLPGRNYPNVCYTIVDSVEIDKEAELDACYPACSKKYENVVGDSEYLPQYSLPQCDFQKIDLLKDSGIQEYASIVIEHLKKKEPVIVVIAVGKTHDNIEVATKLRTIVLQAVEDDKNDISLEKGSNFKSLIIYPYIKEQDLFRPDFHSFYDVLKDGKSVKDYLKNNCDEPTRESSRLYVFDINNSVFLSILAGDSDVKGKKNKDLLKNLFELSDLLFSNEKVPVVSFGRGGYFPSGDEYDAIVLAAKGANMLYSYDDRDENDKEGKEEDKDGWCFFKQAALDHKWGQSLTLPFESKSNVSLALSLPNKLRYLGLRLKDAAFIDVDGNNNITSDPHETIRDVFNSDNKEGVENLVCFERLVKDLDELSKPKQKQDSPFIDVLGILGLDKKISILKSDNAALMKYRENALLTIMGKASEIINLRAAADPFMSAFIGPKAKKKFLNPPTDEPNTNLFDFAKRINDEVGPYFLAAYLIGYDSSITDEGEGIAIIEHARWYFYNAGGGVIPKKSADIKPNKLKSRFKAKNDFKNSLKNVHIFLTSYTGLKTLRDKLASNTIVYSNAILDFLPGFLKNGTKFKDRYPNVDKYLFEEVFKRIYWSDTFVIRQIKAVTTTVEREKNHTQIYKVVCPKEEQ